MKLFLIFRFCDLWVKKFSTGGGPSKVEGAAAIGHGGMNLQ